MGRISEIEMLRAKSASREQAFQEVLEVVTYLSDDESALLKQKIEERVERDQLYRNVVESIQELAQKEVGIEEKVRVVETKLIGTIASVTAGRVIIEPLVSIPIEDGTKIIIKRRTSSGEIPIAEGSVYDVSVGKISARIENRISATRNPIVMDLVYIEVEE
jgi:hypothetical protein